MLEIESRGGGHHIALSFTTGDKRWRHNDGVVPDYSTVGADKILTSGA